MKSALDIQEDGTFSLYGIDLMDIILWMARATISNVIVFARTKNNELSSRVTNTSGWFRQIAVIQKINTVSTNFD